ncbi:WxL protein peptidoglycan domain-containing protein [Streptomyces sp. NPDC089424]|uniref:WxL protein peptidoglycan domain-containing protein n=1 Tax=Streptomyces sp. NPDC089424 TaxID=3365917 RepID=UPI003821FEA1
MRSSTTRRTAGLVTAFTRTATLLLLSALTLVGLQAGLARAADGDVTWTVRTAANGYGDDRSSYTYTVNPGGKVEDAMVVANRSRTPLRLALYAADGYTTDTGQLDLVTKDKKSVAVGAWVHSARDSVVIRPGRSAEIPFTLAVPDDATPGDYVGGILTSLTQSDDTRGINVDRRLGIRVKLRVSGELDPRLAIEDLHVDYTGTSNPFGAGDATVTYTIHNTGNVLLAARQSVSMEGPFGLLRTKAGDIPASPELLPGEKWKVKVPVRDVAPTVTLTATAHLTPLLTDAAGSITPLDPVETTAHGWAVPWVLLGLALALIAAVAVTVVLVRRRRERGKQREDARVREAVAEALARQGDPKDADTAEQATR